MGILVLCVVAGIIGWQIRDLVQECREYRDEEARADG